MTQNTIGFDFGDVVLVPFPFTDQSGAKRRPAIVVSSAAYHRTRADVVVMAVTGRAAPASSTPGETVIIDWKGAGLIKSSVAKPVVATLERHLVLERLGALQQGDRDPVRRALGWIFGFAG